MAARRRQRLQPKYIFRRVVLLALLIALVGGGGWFLVKRILSGGTEQEGGSSMEDSQVSSASSREEPEASLVEEMPEPEPLSTQWNLLLVSAANPLSENFEEPELELINEGYQVDARVAGDLRRMFARAKADGINLLICSAYRTLEYQQNLFDNKVQEYVDYGEDEEAAVKTAATIVAAPGTSEHHTGLAVDIVTMDYQNLDDGYAETPAAKWLKDNAYKFGFILRYPEDKQDITKVIFEPWHYRYVGEETAEVIQENGYCLEEYLYVVHNRQNTESGASDESNFAPQQ